MLSKCANPACSNRFLYFHEGKLYVIESKTRSTDSRMLECFWLCSSCRQEMTIQIDRDRGITILRKRPTQAALAPAG